MEEERGRRLEGGGLMDEQQRGRRGREGRECTILKVSPCSSKREERKSRRVEAERDNTGCRVRVNKEED